VSAPTLAEALARGRDNNLDAVRLAAAFAVVASHAWPLALGRGTPEPLAALTGVSLGGWAVIVFFLVSGVLVTRSAMRLRNDLAGFALARAARILPGLAGALLAVALGALLLTGGATGPGEAASYVLRGITLVSLEHTLPGAFADNPYAGAVNGPLWTLFYEVLAYGLVGGAALLLAVRRRAGAFAAAGLAGLGLALLAAAALARPEAIAHRIEVGGPLLAAFAVGAAAALLARRIRLDWRLCAGLWGLAGLAAAAGSDALVPALTIAVGHTVLMLSWRTPVVRLPADVSYGVYLYGWPVAQGIVSLAGDLSPAALALVSSAAVLPVAWLSAFLVERPALALSRTRPAPARPAVAAA